MVPSVVSGILWVLRLYSPKIRGVLAYLLLYLRLSPQPAIVKLLSLPSPKLLSSRPLMSSILSNLRVLLAFHFNISSFNPVDHCPFLKSVLWLPWCLVSFVFHWPLVFANRLFSFCLKSRCWNSRAFSALDFFFIYSLFLGWYDLSSKSHQYEDSIQFYIKSYDFSFEL